MKAELYCAFCGAKTKVEFDADGWATRYDTIFEEMAMCPEHAKAREFLDAQCPGCVET